jgi:hypothetical protein
VLVRKLVTGALMATALAVPTSMATVATASTTLSGTTAAAVVPLDFLVEGPFETQSACLHRAQFWDDIDGRSHYCVFHTGSDGYRRGWWVYARS